MNRSPRWPQGSATGSVLGSCSLPWGPPQSQPDAAPLGQVTHFLPAPTQGPEVRSFTSQHSVGVSVRELRFQGCQPTRPHLLEHLLCLHGDL